MKALELLIGSAAEVFDRAVSLAVEAGSRRSRRVVVTHDARRAFLERLLLAAPRPDVDFFEAPGLPEVSESKSTRGFSDLRWSSGYQPYLRDFGVRYLATEQNRTAHARLFTGPRPRPVAVVVHGYMSGAYGIEQRLWPLAELSERGFDVALFVLPFHALRADRLRGLVPAFPGSDPRMAIEGFRQAVWDLRGLLRWLAARGHPYAGLFGMSLGAYTAALTATIEPELAFLVPVVPLASLADFSLEQGYLSAPPEEHRVEHALLEQLYSPVSPLARAPRIEPSRVVVIAARADRVTPISHARKLARHFRSPLVSMPGGHLLQLGRGSAFERALGLLTRVRQARG